MSRRAASYESTQDRVSLPLDPLIALRALLAVKPDDPPADSRQDGAQTEQTDDEAATE